MYYLPLLLLSRDNFRVQPEVCDGYHDLMQNVVSFINVAIELKVNN